MNRVKPSRNIRNTDFIDKEFQTLIWPINFMQNMFFLSKHNIKENVIRPNGNIYNCISSIGISCFILIQIYRSYTISTHFFDEGAMQYFSVIMSCFLYGINYIVFLILNIINNNNNVEIIEKIYKAHNFLQSIRSDNFKSMKIWNWVFVSLTFGVNVVLISIHLMVMGQSGSVLSFIFLFSLTYFDVYLLYAKCLLNLIYFELNLWLNEIESYLEFCSEFRVGKNCQNRDDHWRTLFQVYLDLMRAYEVFQKVIKVPVLIQVITVFLHSLMYVQIFIELEKLQIFAQATLRILILEFIILIWTIKTLIYVVIFSVECERFYKTALCINMLCTTIIVHPKSSGQSRRLCKNVHRMYTTSFQRLSACGVFTLDGALIRRLTALLISYTVVLLQFALH